MNRWKAAAIHLSISLAFALVVASLLYFLWFPSPYFIAAGASTLMLLLMGVDVCIGPLLTLLVVTPAKARHLIRLDLAVIGSLQAVAFGYGLYVICQARPVFIVAEIDRLVVVAADEVSDEDLARAKQPVFRKRSWTGPVYAGALPPTGNEATDIAMRVMAGGKDIDRLPQYYVPYDHVIGNVLKHAKTLRSLAPLSSHQREVLAELQRKHPDGTFLALPLERGDSDYTAVVSGPRRQPVAVLALDPWADDSQ